MSKRFAFSLQEYEELAESVRKYPCLYDKSKKEYKDRNVVSNAWRKVAEDLDFVENGQLNSFLTSYL